MADDARVLDGPRYGPKDGRAPAQLVVLCHGVGADGHDLIDLAPYWSAALPEAAFAAPDAPEPYAEAPQGRQWFDISDRAPAHLAAGVRRGARALDLFVDAELKRLNLPADAYALMGFSQGAMTVLFAGLRRDPGPRAILAFSGALVAPETLARERRNLAPVLLVHGEADEVLPASRSREAEQALVAAGVPVEALFRAGLGHGIDDAGLSAGALFLQRAFATR
ncbi:MAG: alpha/beta hydrolase [Acetobacteraceae bacterium]